MDDKPATSQVTKYGRVDDRGLIHGIDRHLHLPMVEQCVLDDESVVGINASEMWKKLREDCNIPMDGTYSLRISLEARPVEPQSGEDGGK